MPDDAEKLTTECGACGKRITFREDKAGHVIRCPNCKKEIALPSVVEVTPQQKNQNTTQRRAFRSSVFSGLQTLVVIIGVLTIFGGPAVTADNGSLDGGITSLFGLVMIACAYLSLLVDAIDALRKSIDENQSNH